MEAVEIINLCISILEFKCFKAFNVDFGTSHLCISILEFKCQSSG